MRGLLWAPCSQPPERRGRLMGSEQACPPGLPPAMLLRKGKLVQGVGAGDMEKVFSLFVFFKGAAGGLLVQVLSHSHRKENLTPFPHG